MNVWLRQLGTLEFWKALLDSFGGLGPIAPIVLAMVESFFPPLPYKKQAPITASPRSEGQTPRW